MSLDGISAFDTNTPLNNDSWTEKYLKTINLLNQRKPQFFNNNEEEFSKRL